MKKFLKTTHAVLIALVAMFGTSQAVALADVDINIGKEAEAQNIPGVEHAGSADGGFGVWLGQILKIILVIAVLLVFVNLIMGAIEWITSGGDSGKLQKARDRILQSIIGLVVLTLSLTIMLAIQGFLGIDVLRVDSPSTTPPPASAPTSTPAPASSATPAPLPSGLPAVPF